MTVTTPITTESARLSLYAARGGTSSTRRTVFRSTWEPIATTTRRISVITLFMTNIEISITAHIRLTLTRTRIIIDIIPIITIFSWINNAISTA
jgi:hypothetical protein